MIACTHPGKIGDVLYALPAVRALCERHGCRADFYTSAYCEPLRRLLEAQSCIARVIVPGAYVVERHDCGTQPWEMPVEGDYEAVYHLGYRSVPDRSLHQFIAAQIGLIGDVSTINYEFPSHPTLDMPYLAMAARGDTSYRDLFREVARNSPVPIVEFGAVGEAVGDGHTLDLTGADFVDIMSWLEHSVGFVGMSSAVLVAANGFPIIKVVPHDGRSWDARHWIKSSAHHYLVDPDPEAILCAVGLNGRPVEPRGLCKTYDPADCYSESAHILTVERALSRVPHRWEHPLRAWEYGLALHAISSHGCRTVLDVGGGGSVFAPAASMLGLDITQVDPGDCADWVAKQAEVVGHQLSYRQMSLEQFESGSYDAVTCLSVLEHVEDDVDFFRRLQSFVAPGGLLILTVDWWPSGLPMIGGHLRTYNVRRLGRLMDEGLLPGFSLVGLPDYVDRGNHVHSYTFASLVMRRSL